MMHYKVFGDLLETPLPFPELRPGAGSNVGRPRWHLELSDDVEPKGPLMPLGEEQLANGVVARLWRSPSGEHVLRFEDTGAFRVSADGSRIRWHLPDQDQLELGRIDFLGRVLAVAAHLQGQLCLHGSAVALSDGAALGFMAPKGFGKSTLALELVREGARLLTDDTLPVHPQTGEAGPGVHSVRLHEDVLERHRALGRKRVSLGVKTVVEELPEQALTERRTPLSTLYALVPVSPGEAVRREELPSPVAVLTLIQYSKLGALLGGPAAAEVLDRAASIASRVRVCRLFVPRRLSRLPEVAAALGEWEAPARTTWAPAG